MSDLQKKVNQRDLYLFFVYLLLIAGILGKSIIDPKGGLNYDSTAYLNVTQNLLKGHGPYFINYWAHPTQITYFAVWPFGYPALIYLLSKYLGLSVFFSSKLINIICIGFSFVVFKYFFKENAYVYALIYFVASLFVTFTNSWSEAPFILSLICFSFSLYLFIIQQETKLIMISVALSSFALFLFRYIGVFSLFILLIMSCYYFVKKHYSKTISLFLIACSGIGIFVVYLYINFINTGYITGISRSSSSESFVQFFSMLLNGILIETNLMRSPRELTILNFKFFPEFCTQMTIAGSAHIFFEI